MKRITFAASAAMFASLILASVPALADYSYDENTKTYTVSNAADFTSALSAVNSADSGEYTIKLEDDFSLDGISFIKNTITVDGQNHTISDVNSVGLSQGANVTIKNVIFQGTGETSNNPGMFHVPSGTVLNMEDGAVIKNSKRNTDFGAGVTVYGGTFNMNGGIIEDCEHTLSSVCFGGGVGVIRGGTFNMSGGTIRNCHAKTTVDGKGNTINTSSWQVPNGAGGGVFVGGGASFNMTGGTIQNCTASTDGGGVAIVATSNAYTNNGRQWGHLDSRFSMSGGTISGCSADLVGGGVAVLGTYVQANSMLAPNPYTGAVADSGIYISGGSIENNTAVQGEGGGIVLFWIRPTVQLHNATVTGNSAPCGAGIDILDDYTVADIDNCTITNNNAADEGGGVVIYNNKGTTIKNCTITGNTSGELGAGVYYDADSKLTISGANTIQNNTYNGKANNLNVLSTTNPVYVNGALTGSTIGLSDPTLWGDNLTDEDSTAVSADYLTSGYAANNAGVNPSVYFTSDHNTWHADFSDVNVNEVRLFRATEPLVMVLPYASGENTPHAYSDAGYYGAEEDDLDNAKGVIRFSTYVECVSGIVIDHVGTTVSANGNSNTIDYAIPSATDVSFTFSVDVTDIPKAAWGTGITATSYAKSGSDTFNSMNSQTLSVGSSPKWLGKDGYSGEVYTDTDPDSAAVAEIKGGN